MSLNRNIKYYKEKKQTIAEVSREMTDGLNLLNSIKLPIVTFFGAHRVKENNRYFKHCSGLAAELGSKGFAIVSGGGPGIMRAANVGATRVHAPSIGLKAALLTEEQQSNGVFTHELAFKYLFVRRFLLAIKSNALVFYPGGYGTLNELFEYLMLMETKVVDVVPIVCVDKKFWRGLFRWLQRTPLRRDLLARKKSLNLVKFVDSISDAVEILGK